MRHCTHRDCGSLLTPVARYCPRCGRRVRRGRWLAVTLAIVLLVGFVLIAGTRSRRGPVQIPPLSSDSADRNDWPANQRSPFSKGPTR
ncbi:MAG TPA: hypothetical protein VF595_13935 [Tepidisphaeraceae bacterium]|jgi:hypothetical protein